MSQFTPTKLWDVATCFELFSTAVADKRRALLRGVVNDVTHDHQIRFIRHGDAGENKGVWVEFLAGDASALELEYRQKTPVEVSFSAGDAMAFFDTVIERRKSTLLWRERRLLLRAPNRISVLQQRKDGRAWVPDNFDLRSQLAKVTDGADGDRSATLINGRVWDISLSGASLVCPADPALIGLRQEERLQFELTHLVTRVKLNAAVCYARPLSRQSVRLGVQFVKEDGSIPTPAEVDPNLQKLLTELRSFRARSELYDLTVAKMAG